MFKRIVSIFLVAFLIIFAFVLPAQAFPLQAYLERNSGVPDWTQVSFDNMGVVEDSNTGILDDVGLMDQLGYNPSRSYSEGDRVSTIIKVGDLDILTQNKSTIGEFLGGVNPRNISLAEFPAINGASINDLIQSVPGLGAAKVHAVPLVNAIASGSPSQMTVQGLSLAKDLSPEVAGFLKANPWAANLPIEQLMQGDWEGVLGKGLEIGLPYLVKEVPSLAQVPLGDLFGSAMSGDYKGLISTGAEAVWNKFGNNIPGAGNIPVGSLVGDVLSGNYRGLLSTGLDMSVAQFAQQFPQLANAPIGALANISNFSMASVPNLASLALATPWIKNQIIKNVPGLANVPLDSLLTIFKAASAKVDITEQGNSIGPRAMTGGGASFMSIPCTGPACSGFEVNQAKALIPADRLNGLQMVVGDRKGKKGQGTKGGIGVIGSKMFGGKEPVHIRPWGDDANIAMAVLSVNDVKGTAQLGFFLRVCFKPPFMPRQCTPYAIGPIPFKSVHEGEVVVIQSTSPPPIKAPNGGSTDGVNCSLPATPKKKYGYSAYAGAQANELESVPTSMNRGETLHKDAASSFNKMRSDAASQGIDLSVISGYRSVDDQQKLWDDQVAKRGNEIEAAKVSAPPGYSEHQTGYALDVGTNDPRTNFEQSFKSTPAYAWLNKNAAQYGFTQSYTGEQGQGAGEEPWHWRYEGNEKAKEVFHPTESPGTYNCSGNSGASDCTVYKGVHLGAFKEAIAKIESPGIGPSAVGPMLSPVKNDPFYQVAIGKYQFMTFREEVKAEVTKNNGYGWLQSIWTGRKPTAEEVLKYFPPDAQERVMSAESSDLINQAQQRGVSPEAYVRTAAMIHNGGTGYSEGSSWTPGGLTVGQYGDQVLSDYKAALPGAQQKCKEARETGGVNPNNPGGSTGTFSNPVPGTIISDEFDPTSSNWRGRPHKGIDEAGPRGSKVGAADGGRVDAVGFDEGGWGNFVIVDHGNGYATLYGHLDSTSVKQGQGVGKMDEIGKLGSTGGSTGPHLHLEVIEGYKSGDIHSGYSIDPRKKIKF